MELSPIESLRIRSPMDTWTTLEHLYLTSAVSQNGEQNWAAVSRAIRLLNTDSTRPQDWFSTKNCALQYAKLLEQVDTPKRKREKNEDQFSETPGQSVHRIVKRRRVEELKRVIEEEKTQYLQMKKDISLLEMKQTETVLHQYWDGIMHEQNKADEEAAKKMEFYKEREEKLKKIYAARLSIKGGSLVALKKRMSPTKHLPAPVVGASSTTSDLSTPEGTDEAVQAKESAETTYETAEIVKLKAANESANEEELLLKDKHVECSEEPDAESVSKNLSFEVKEEEDVKSFDGFGISPAHSEGAVKKSCVAPSTLDSTDPLDYASNLSSAREEEDASSPNKAERNVGENDAVRMQQDHDYTQEEESGSNLSVKLKEDPDRITDEIAPPRHPESESLPDTLPAECLDGVFPTPVETEQDETKVRDEPKDEYEFDDEASRDSAEVKEYMSRMDRKKFSFGEVGVASPVISEDTPSSPASTNYGDDPEAEKLHRSWKRSVMLVWNDIAAHKNASIFLKPITEDRVPGYHSIVYRPLDLMTIKRSIENGVIRSTQEFQRDVMIMFVNALMYNKESHNVYRMTGEMMKDAMETIEEFIQAQQVMPKVSEVAPQKTLRRETRESSSKRGGSEDGKRKREDKEEKVKRKKTT